jgi:hypothetical protein
VINSQTDEFIVPIYYDDGKLVHACESYSMHAGPPLVRTRCNKEVPLNEGFTLQNVTIEVTCTSCLAWH